MNDFLNKANIRTQLLPWVPATTRIARRENELSNSNSLVEKKVKDLQTTDLIDPVTGLGNLRFTLERLQATLKQSEAQGGTACMLLIGINNLEEMKSQFEQLSIDEAMSGMNAKNRGLVRPLDVVTRREANLFAVITLQESMKNCTSQSFKRVFDSLYMHSFRTNEGYIPAVIGVSITGVDSSTGHPSAKNFMRFSQDGLNLSYETDSITARPFDSHPKYDV